MDILEALSKLDPANNDHWTADGAPRVGSVAALVGNPALTRSDITNAAPSFHRHGLEQAQGVGPSADDGISGVGVGPLTEDGASGVGVTDDETVQAASEDEELAAAVNAPAPTPLSELEPAAPPAPLTELERLELEAKELEQLMNASFKVAREARADADRMADQVNALNRRMEVLRRHDPNHDTAGIRAYLRQQNANRLARAEGLQRFVNVTGVHPSDVAAAVDPRSPIDRSMSQRKPTRGSMRPTR